MFQIVCIQKYIPQAFQVLSESTKITFTHEMREGTLGISGKSAKQVYQVRHKMAAVRTLQISGQRKKYGRILLNFWLRSIKRT